MGIGPFQIFAPKWDRKKNEITLARIGPNGQLNIKADFVFTVAFEDIEALRGMPAVEALNAIAGEVERIIRATEAECRRLKLLC